MADLSDVQNALVTLAAQTIYPNGTAQPSVANAPVMIYAGWPVPTQLDTDLAAGKVHVSVYARPEERNTTRFSRDWQTLSVNTATLTLAATTTTVTIGGTVSIPQNATIRVNGKSYSYALQVADTLTSIATALAALVNVGTPSTSSGAVVTIPSAYNITVRVGTTGTSIRELRRQERVFQIVVWASTPALRDAVIQPLDVAMAALNFITLTDGTAARLIYKSSPITDDVQKDRLYRRDLFYSVEYATTQTAINTAVTAMQTNISDQPTGATAPVSTFTINQ
jgi:hypothetical protein